jgi:3-carboxy-cis,cis-muconate cycloisomerase
MTASPFDHPFLSGLLGDAEVSTHLSADADIRAMLDFEIALAEAEAAEGVVPMRAGAAIARELAGFQPDMAALAAGTARDGVVVPALVEQLRKVVGAPNGEFVHFGATSQDAIDTSAALRFAKIAAVLGDWLDQFGERLAALEARDGAIRAMAHTRMQQAIEVTASRKIASWREPLLRHRARLGAVVDEIAILTLGGAAGTVDKLGDKGPAVAERVAARLGLRFVPRARHSERDGSVAFANWLALVTGSLGKLGQDVALLAQNEVGEVKLAAGGGSSAMPHKVNPVGAEILVALARFNATLVAGMQQAMVHENERSGAAWTLEWLLLPQMAVATGTALRTALELVEGLSFVRKGGV